MLQNSSSHQSAVHLLGNSAGSLILRHIPAGRAAIVPMAQRVARTRADRDCNVLISPEQTTPAPDAPSCTIVAVLSSLRGLRRKASNSLRQRSRAERLNQTIIAHVPQPCMSRGAVVPGRVEPVAREGTPWWLQFGSSNAATQSWISNLGEIIVNEVGDEVSMQSRHVPQHVLGKLCQARVCAKSRKRAKRIEAKSN